MTMKTTEPAARPQKKAAPIFSAGPRSRALHEKDLETLTPGLQSIALMTELAMEKGQGAVLTDADGRSYIDFAAGIGVASIGHGHPEYARVVSEQVGKLSVGSFTTEHRASFGQRLKNIAPPGLDHYQLYSSGAEAVEAALRLAKSRTKKFEFMAFWGGFHGKTGGVLGMIGDEFKHQLGPSMPGLYLSPYPNPYRCPFGAKEQHDCAAHCLDFLRAKIKRETTGALAAILCEPIQGTAGNVVPPPGWLAGIREIARENGALWISDEMITGFGRTGAWFGCDHERGDGSVIPDILTIGKGVGGGFPVSGLITSAETAQARPFANPSGSSSSYGGNPLAAAACDVTLKILAEEKLPENARKVGAALLERMKGWTERFDFVGDVRGRGLMIGVELVEDKKSRKPLPKDRCRVLFEEALSRGLLTMAYAPAIRINPPLNIPMDLALKGAGILEESLIAFERRLRA